tara:strand:+ start:1262 stop:1546 length:285 start_codon:yes stop_codon:yes gene_type:complete
MEIRKKYNWENIKNNLSEKNSLCCKEPMILLGGGKSDVGICSKCRGLAFDKNNQQRLSSNRYQSFKKIADDGIYNNSFRKKPKIYTRFKHSKRM